MLSLSARISVLLLCAAYVNGSRVWTYRDLESTGISCPSRDKCSGYKKKLTYMDRNCECDNECIAYKDCCIDAPSTRRSSSSRTPVRTDHVKCIQYGDIRHAGVYVISECSKDWTGPREVMEKCVGPVDESDPINGAPVTDTDHSLTYRNLFCATCNNAYMESLKTFQIRVSCSGLEEFTEEQIWADLYFNQNLRSWGVNRINVLDNATDFVSCSIKYDIPGYLNNSIRFCRSNLISSCAPDWNLARTKDACSSYTAVVYDKLFAYKNPHCALCNHKIADELSCKPSSAGETRPFHFGLLLDINQSDGDEVGKRKEPTQQCISGQKYDPFFKSCKQVVCIIPGYVLMGGKCVKE